MAEGECAEFSRCRYQSVPQRRSRPILRVSKRGRKLPFILTDLPVHYPTNRGTAARRIAFLLTPLVRGASKSRDAPRLRRHRDLPFVPEASGGNRWVSTRCSQLMSSMFSWGLDVGHRCRVHSRRSHEPPATSGNLNCGGWIFYDIVPFPWNASHSSEQRTPVACRLTGPPGP